MRKDARRYANNGNGLIIAHQVMRQCPNYANLFAPLIATMSGGGFGDLALDMISYSILKQLTEKENDYQVLDDEALVLSQLRNIADFAGMFFKAFPTVDL
jgi:hypothetical protein